MNSDLPIIIDEPISSYFAEITGTSPIEFKISLNNNQEIFEFTWIVSDLNEFMKGYTHLRDYRTRKNDLQVLAIKNLIKISNSLQLNLQLAEKTISDKEFEEAIDTNPDRYFVDVKPVADEADLIVIGDILTEVSPIEELESDQVANIFSIEHGSLIKIFNYGKMLPYR